MQASDKLPCPIFLLLFVSIVSFTSADDVFRFYHFYRDFEFHSKKLSWSDASFHCQTRHGSLVTVNNAYTQQFFYSLFLSRSEVVYMDYWIGLHKRNSEPWRWMSGQIFNYSSWYQRPRSATSGHSCAKMLSHEHLKWICSDCHKANGFICEYRPKGPGLQVAVSGHTEKTDEETWDPESLPEHWMWAFYSAAVLIVLLLIVIVTTCCVCVNSSKVKTSKTAPVTERVSCPGDSNLTHYAFI